MMLRLRVMKKTKKLIDKLKKICYYIKGEICIILKVSLK